MRTTNDQTVATGHSVEVDPARTVGVQRQYTGTAGKVDNAQVAVYLAYATAAGMA